MWAEKKNNSRTGGKDEQERRRRERKRRRRKDEVMARKKKIKRRKRRRKTPLDPAETEQEAHWFLSIYSSLPLHNRQGRGFFVQDGRRGGGRWWWALMICETVGQCLSLSKQPLTSACRLMKEQHWRATTTQPATASAAAAEQLELSENSNSQEQVLWAANNNGRNCLTQALGGGGCWRL